MHLYFIYCSLAALSTNITLIKHRLVLSEFQLADLSTSSEERNSLRSDIVFIIKTINTFTLCNANWCHLALFPYTDDAILHHPSMTFQLSTILSALRINRSIFVRVILKHCLIFLCKSYFNTSRFISSFMLLK